MFDVTIERERLESLDQFQLDEEVYEKMDEEASVLNNQGRQAQIDYLLGLK